MSIDEQVSPGRRRSIEIVDYDPGWPRAFAEIRDAMRRLLGAAVAEVDHVGSTAVPALSAVDWDKYSGGKAPFIAEIVRRAESRCNSEFLG